MGWPTPGRFWLEWDVQILPSLSSRPEQIIAKRRSVEWRDLVFYVCVGWGQDRVGMDDTNTQESGRQTPIQSVELPHSSQRRLECATHRSRLKQNARPEARVTIPVLQNYPARRFRTSSALFNCSSTVFFGFTSCSGALGCSSSSETTVSS